MNFRSLWFFIFLRPKVIICVYIFLFFYVCHLIFPHKHTCLRRFCNVIHYLDISLLNMFPLVIWCLSEWNEVLLSCCLFLKLHFLFVRLDVAPRIDQWTVVTFILNQRKATASLHPNWNAFNHYWQSASVWDYELLLPALFLYSGYQDIVSTWLAAFLCPDIIQKFDCMTLTQFCSL